MSVRPVLKETGDDEKAFTKPRSNESFLLNIDYYNNIFTLIAYIWFE